MKELEQLSKFEQFLGSRSIGLNLLFPLIMSVDINFFLPFFVRTVLEGRNFRGTEYIFIYFEPMSYLFLFQLLVQCQPFLHHIQIIQLHPEHLQCFFPLPGLHISNFIYHILYTNSTFLALQLIHTSANFVKITNSCAKTSSLFPHCTPWLKINRTL